MCPGYCSLLYFSEGDLGIPLAADKVPAHIQPLMKAAAKAAAPATPEQPAPAKASRKSQPPGTPVAAQKPDQFASARGINALQAAPEPIEPRTEAAAPAGPSGRLEACEPYRAAADDAGKEAAQLEPTGAAQERPSQASTPLTESGQPEQAPTLKRPLAEILLGQRFQAETSEAGSAVKKQKRIIPTALPSAPSALLAPTGGEDSHLTLCTQ